MEATYSLWQHTTDVCSHTCKSWISPVSDRTYLNILDMMNSPEKGDSSGHMPTWAQLCVAKLRRTWKPAKTILDRISKHPNNNNKINCLTLSSNFYFGCQGKVDVEFQNKVKILIHIISENRNRHSSSLNNICSVTCIVCLFDSVYA